MSPNELITVTRLKRLDIYFLLYKKKPPNISRRFFKEIESLAFVGVLRYWISGYWICCSEIDFHSDWISQR